MSAELNAATLEEILASMRGVGEISLRPTTMIIPTIEQAWAAFDAGLEPYCPLAIVDPPN